MKKRAFYICIWIFHLLWILGWLNKRVLWHETANKICLKIEMVSLIFIHCKRCRVMENVWSKSILILGSFIEWCFARSFMYKWLNRHTHSMTIFMFRLSWIEHSGQLRKIHSSEWPSCLDIIYRNEDLSLHKTC